jgi:hypothetical protein
MQIRNQPDFLSGLLFLIVGTAAALYASRYELGTAYQMGPGFFPVILGSLLAALGLIILVRSLLPNQEEEKVEPISFRPLLWILGSVILFGALLLNVGIVLATAILVIVSSLASREFNLRYVIPTAVVLAAGCYLIFIYGLGLPIPTWIGGAL